MILYLYRMEASYRMLQAINDAQKMHQLLCEMAGNRRREDAGILYMPDLEHGLLFVQSEMQLKTPDNGLHLLKKIDIEKKISSINAGEEISFVLTTDPRRKKEGKIVYISDIEESKEWVKRRLEERGFETKSIYWVSRRQSSFMHGNEKGGKASVSFSKYKITGIVHDTEKFFQAWKNGLGWHKAYGNGLFLLLNE